VTGIYINNQRIALPTDPRVHSLVVRITMSLGVFFLKNPHLLILIFGKRNPLICSVQTQRGLFLVQNVLEPEPVLWTSLLHHKKSVPVARRCGAVQGVEAREREKRAAAGLIEPALAARLRNN